MPQQQRVHTAFGAFTAVFASAVPCSVFLSHVAQVLMPQQLLLAKTIDGCTSHLSRFLHPARQIPLQSYLLIIVPLNNRNRVPQWKNSDPAIVWTDVVRPIHYVQRFATTVATSQHNVVFDNILLSSCIHDRHLFLVSYYSKKDRGFITPMISKVLSAAAFLSSIPRRDRLPTPFSFLFGLDRKRYM